MPVSALRRRTTSASPHSHRPKRARTTQATDPYPLHSAVEAGDIRAIDALFTLSDSQTRSDLPDINAQNTSGETALHVAVRDRQIMAIKKLLAFGADMSLKNKNGETPVNVAEQYGPTLIVTLLNGQAERNKDFLQAAHDGKFEEIKGSLSNDAQFNARDKNGQTALHIAAAKGHEEIAEHLLNEYFADVHAKDNDGNTALHLAATAGKFDVVKFLLELGADPSLQNHKGKTSAGSAEENSHISDYLKEQIQLNLNFLQAVHEEKYEKIKIFLTQGAQINTRDEKGQTALHIAAAMGNRKILDHLLCELDSDTNAQDHEGNTALHVAAAKGDAETAFDLLNFGINTEIKNRKNEQAEDMPSTIRAMMLVWSSKKNISDREFRFIKDTLKYLSSSEMPKEDPFFLAWWIEEMIAKNQLYKLEKGDIDQFKKIYNGTAAPT